MICFEIFLKSDERAQLLKLGLVLGPAIRHVITIVDDSTFRRWARRASGEQPPAKTGRPRISVVIREQVVQIAKETGWGHSRIVGELKELGVGRISRQTIKNILVEHGLDPGPTRGRGNWSEVQSIQPTRCGNATSSASASGPGRDRDKSSPWRSFTSRRVASSSLHRRFRPIDNGLRSRQTPFSTTSNPSKLPAPL